VQSIIESVPIAHTQDWTRVEVPTYFDGKRPGHQPAPNSTPQSSAAPRIDKAMLVALYRKHRKTPKQIRAAKARFAREGAAIDLPLGWGFEVDDADRPASTDGLQRLTATITATVNEIVQTATGTDNLQLLLDLKEVTVVHDERPIRVLLTPH
jgi:hypothetical protein